jgi:endonuclease/exonuclease/phosphatase family metal-dependent hydrolase
MGNRQRLFIIDHSLFITHCHMYRFLYLVLLIIIGSPYAIAQKNKLRLLSYNIRNSKGMDNKVDYERTAAVLRSANAAIIGLQEVDSVTKRSAGVDVLKIMAEKTGMHAVYGAAIPLQGGQYGVGVLSKEKPVRYHTIPLPGKEEKRVLLIVEFKHHVIFNTHLSLTDSDRIASVTIINQQAVHFKKPIYLMGDLNAEPASTTLLHLKQHWTLLSGEAPTFPASTPTKCIDYILAMNLKKAAQLSTTVIDDPITSDHRPVLVW